MKRAPAITIGPDALVEAAARLMYDHRIKRLPVINSAGRLVGIVTRVDLLAVYRRSDKEIRDEILHQALPETMLALPATSTPPSATAASPSPAGRSERTPAEP